MGPILFAIISKKETNTEREREKKKSFFYFQWAGPGCGWRYSSICPSSYVLLLLQQQLLRCALPEDYNIHQNWKIAVEIHQFGVCALSSPSIPTRRPFRASADGHTTDDPAGSIHTAGLFFFPCDLFFISFFFFFSLFFVPLAASFFSPPLAY